MVAYGDAAILARTEVRVSAAATLGPAIAAELPRLRSFAYRLTHDAEAARDLIQDTALKALRNADRFQAGTNLRAWLGTIMHNEHVNTRRRMAVRVTSQLDVQMPDEIGGGQEAATMLREVLALSRRLPEHHRHALLRTAAGDMLHEIAHATGRPIGSVKSSVSRARAQIAAMAAAPTNFSASADVVGGIREPARADRGNR